MKQDIFGSVFLWNRRTYYSQQAESTPLRVQPSAPVYNVQSVPTYEKGYNNVQYEIQPHLVVSKIMLFFLCRISTIPVL